MFIAEPFKFVISIAHSSKAKALITRQLKACLVLGFTGCCLPVGANEFVDVQQVGVINLGVELSDSQLHALPLHVFSDGAGLPEGSGSVEQGAALYSQHCAGCHGTVGQGGKALELVGDRALLTTDYPDRGIAVFWPYAPTLYEYINRSMPPETPGMFSADELYAIIAHLLYLNAIIDKGAVLDARMLSDIQLPNEEGFDTVAQ